MDESLESKFATLKSKNLKIDLTRGKPGSDQLDLSNDLLNLMVPATVSYTHLTLPTIYSV